MYYIKHDSCYDSRSFKNCMYFNKNKSQSMARPVSKNHWLIVLFVFGDLSSSRCSYEYIYLCSAEEAYGLERHENE